MQVRSVLVCAGAAAAPRLEAAGAIDGFSGHNISNMVWGCAKLRFLHPQLLAALAGCAADASGCGQRAV